MKIWVTKKDPYEFVARGMDSLTIWFLQKPRFEPLETEDPLFGNTYIRHARWTGDHSVSGKVFRKWDNEISLDIWQALLFSYQFDPEKDLYEPVREYYNAEYYSRLRLYEKDHPEPEYNYDTGEGKDAHDGWFYRQCEYADKYASISVEKEGQRWWEWCLQYDVDLAFSL